MILHDERLPIEQLYASYDRLAHEFGWQRQIISTHDTLPQLVFTTPKVEPALWILAGVHGEEPAGPNAIAQNIEIIAQLGQQFPIVLFPLCNPRGYVKNWRYPNEERDWHKGESVTDSLVFRSKVAELLSEYPALLSIDHHEDEALSQGYTYSQGNLGADDPVAARVIELMEASGVSIQKSGMTRFGEKINNGVVGPVHDESIDEFLATQGVKCVIVVETPTMDMSLPDRIKAHSAIIQHYSQLLALA